MLFLFFVMDFVWTLSWLPAGSEKSGCSMLKKRKTLFFLCFPNTSTHIPCTIVQCNPSVTLIDLDFSFSVHILFFSFPNGFQGDERRKLDIHFLHA